MKNKLTLYFIDQTPEFAEGYNVFNKTRRISCFNKFEESNQPQDLVLIDSLIKTYVEQLVNVLEYRK